MFKIIVSSKITGEQTQDNGAVVRLATGDTLTVTMVSPVSAKCYYISSNATASFFGMLLSPESYI